MTNPLYQLLDEKFGFKSFRPGQEEAIESVLNGKDTLVMLPTGTGKSLCYQLPTYALNGTTLVVSPLLSLMQDQVENLRLNGEKRVVALNSLTPYSERARIFNRIDQYRFIYTSPEMLQNPEVISHLKRANIRLFVVDEAHCISHWGMDFRPDYLALAQVRKQLNNPTTMALTATATKQVRSEIIHFLGLDEATTNQIIQSVDRPEIKFIVEHCYGDKFEKILYYVQQMKGPGIIYFMSKKLADEMAYRLRTQHQIKAESYHADIDGDDKVKIQQQYQKNNIQVICATSAFGMGFDKEDIRYVIHYHMPDSPEMYLQEVGRASRDGQTGLAILLYQNGDEQIQRRFLEESLPTRELLQYVVGHPNTSFSHEDSLYRLAKHYMQMHTSIEGALQTIADRKSIKEKQIDYMLQYIFSDGCKRAFLLHYFEEKKNEKSAICCSSCGVNAPEIMEEMNQKAVFDGEERNGSGNWKETIYALYNID